MPGPVLTVLGAQDEARPLAAEYIRVIAYGTAFQILATGLVPFIRNLGGSAFAMVAMGTGFVTNIPPQMPRSSRAAAAPCRKNTCAASAPPRAPAKWCSGSHRRGRCPCRQPAAAPLLFNMLFEKETEMIK